MHIVYATLTKMGGGGGDVIHVSELAEELVRCGARVTLIASGRPNPPLAGVESIDAGRIVSRGFFTRIFTFSLLVLRVLLQVVRRRSRSDVIYTRDALLACWLATWRRLFRLPVVFEVNGLRADESRMLFGAFFGRWVCAIGRRAERTAARHADRLICVTAGIRDVLRDEYGVPPERMDVVPNGVNLRLFTPEVPAERREQLRKELGIRPDDAVICYLGGLQPWQDVSTLIQAAGRVKLADRGVILLIAGDGRKRRQWEDEARRLHPQLRAIFTGRIPYRQAGDYISLADVCAMPLTSKRNARIGVSPIKLYAYLACGKPIVATQIRGFEFLQTEGLGTTIPCGDIDAYAGALRDWLNKTPAQAGHISRRARAYAEKHCGWDRIAQSVFAVCRTLRKSE